MEHVLGLEPLGNLTLAVDHRRRGSLVHDVLATFHRELSEAPDDAWAAILGDEERFAVELSRRLADVMAAGGLGREGLEAALLELDRREIQKWIARYHEHYAKYDAAWSSLEKPMRPAHFELRFGQRRPGDTSAEDPRSIDKAFSLDVGGEKILVTGRIDRIDVGRAGGKPVFNVIDYKSGKRPTLTAKKIESGERLQPALYVMAAQALVFDKEQAVPMWAGYWSLKNGVTTDKNYSLQCSVEGTNPSEDWSNLRPKVLATIRKFVHDIRDGNFRVFSLDHDCTSRCEFNMVCRVAQVRSLNKGAPAVES
jgi:ATP-dependent helicase/DNAse subunit B